MIRRTTWILLLVFGVLVLFAFLFQRYQANKIEAIPTATIALPVVKVYNLTNLQVTDLKAVDKDGNQIDLYRDESTSNNWAIRDVPVDQADKVGIETTISQLLSLQVIDQLTDNPPLDSIGLTTPAYTIIMETTDGQRIVTEVGSKTPIGTGYYVRVDSGPIIIVNNLTLDDVLNFINKPPLLATATPETTTTESGTPLAPEGLATPTP